jgi:hypothetical protein
MSTLSYLRYCLLLMALITNCASSHTQQRLSDLPEGNLEPPKVGVRVIEVDPGGQLDNAGIQVMDLLSKYGKFEVVDHSTYYKAREFYLRTPHKRVKVQFWRGRVPMMIEVLPGTIGGSTNEYSAIAYQLDSAMMKVNALNQVSDFRRMVEFKSQFENNGFQQALDKAREIIDRAEAEGTLTATQILVGRIGLILDNAPEEDLKTLDVLVAEFVRNQSPEYIGWLGEEFRDKSHYRAARQLIKSYLLTDPDNISMRLNLGQACLNLGLWNEVDAGADLVLSDPEELSPHGFYVAYQQKALVALSRNDFDRAIELSIVQLAAAMKGDVEKVSATSRLYQEQLPKDYETFKLQILSAEALALSMSGKDELARAVVAGSQDKDRVEGKLKQYWRFYPNGNKAVENWMRLSKN